MKFPFPHPRALATFLALGLAAPLIAEIAPEETLITSSSAEIWTTDRETRATFSGNVVVTGTNLRMTCDRLEITAIGQNEQSATVGKLEKFKHLVATGRVHIVQGAREANCERAEVFPREEKVVLTGQPVVIDKEAGFVATGEPMQLLRGQRRVSGENIKITLPPIRDLGFEKNAPTGPVAPETSAVKPPAAK
jgi:lipopolysaccharide export system protein LptA